MRGRIAAVVLAVFLGVLGSHQVLYKLLLVPRLPAYHSVPILVWFSLASPVLIAAVLGGMGLRTLREATLTSLLGGVAILAYESWACLTMQPGCREQTGLETEPLVFGPLYLVVTMAALMLTFGAGRVLKKLGRWWFTASERMSVSPQ